VAALPRLDPRGIARAQDRKDQERRLTRKKQYGGGEEVGRVRGGKGGRTKVSPGVSRIVRLAKETRSIPTAIVGFPVSENVPRVKRGAHLRPSGHAHPNAKGDKSQRGGT